MPKTKSVIPPALVEGLHGSLSQTYVFDVLQFLQSSTKTGELYLKLLPEEAEARAYFNRGSLVHVVAGDIAGLEALVEIAGWDRGSFKFSEDVLSPTTTIDMPLQHALLEAVRIHDERRNQEEEAARDERRDAEMAQPTRSSTDVLEDFLKVPGVMSAVVVGRDGFLIESSGTSTAVSIEDLGASLAHAVNGVEEMGNELQIKGFQDLFVEYGRAVIMCRPVGDAIIAVVAPDASKLGIIRHKVKPLVEELANYF